MKNLTSSCSKDIQLGKLLGLIPLTLVLSCGDVADQQDQDTNAVVTEELIEPIMPAESTLELEPIEEPAITSPEEVDEFSREEIEKMANSGEADQDIIPELNFWDKVGKDGSFAAFQKALKAAKTDEDRWKIADKYPEIAERSGMIDALPPRKDSTQVKK